MTVELRSAFESNSNTSILDLGWGDNCLESYVLCTLRKYHRVSINSDSNSMIFVDFQARQFVLGVASGVSFPPKLDI